MSVVHANTVAAMSGHMLQIWGAKFQPSHNRKMAIPTLAAMAALTLLQNPHMQPEDVAVNYGDLNTYASRVQRYQRRRSVVSRAAATINRVMRGLLARTYDTATTILLMDRAFLDAELDLMPRFPGFNARRRRQVRARSDYRQWWRQ